MRQSTEAKLALQKAVADANVLLGKVNALNQSLSLYGITLTIPQTPR